MTNNYPADEVSGVMEQGIEEMRDWIAGRTCDDLEPDDIAVLRVSEILSTVRLNYEGGLAQWMIDYGESSEQEPQS